MSRGLFLYPREKKAGSAGDQAVLSFGFTASPESRRRSSEVRMTPSPLFQDIMHWVDQHPDRDFDDFDENQDSPSTPETPPEITEEDQ